MVTAGGGEPVVKPTRLGSVFVFGDEEGVGSVATARQEPIWYAGWPQLLVVRLTYSDGFFAPFLGHALHLKEGGRRLCHKVQHSIRNLE